MTSIRSRFSEMCTTIVVSERMPATEPSTRLSDPMTRMLREFPASESSGGVAGGATSSSTLSVFTSPLTRCIPAYVAEAPKATAPTRRRLSVRRTTRGCRWGACASGGRAGGFDVVTVVNPRMNGRTMPACPGIMRWRSCKGVVFCPATIR